MISGMIISLMGLLVAGHAWSFLLCHCENPHDWEPAAGVGSPTEQDTPEEDLFVPQERDYEPE